MEFLIGVKSNLSATEVMKRLEKLFEALDEFEVEYVNKHEDWCPVCTNDGFDFDNE